jgi:hypothetical protein
MVVCACNPSYSGGVGKIVSKAGPKQNVQSPIWKVTKAKGAGKMAQALGLNNNNKK